jgi:Ni,Fe-hydrogenase I cytochrome b subunit
MHKKRWIFGVAYTAAFLTAFILMGRDMWRDIAATPGDPVLIVTLILMTFGIGVTCYGLYHERHKARAYVVRRRHVHMRFARRRIIYNPAPRRSPVLPADAGSTALDVLMERMAH